MELSPGWEEQGKQAPSFLSGEEGWQVGVGEGLAWQVFVLVVWATRRVRSSLFLPQA